MGLWRSVALVELGAVVCDGDGTPGRSQEPDGRFAAESAARGSRILSRVLSPELGNGCTHTAPNEDTPGRTPTPRPPCAQDKGRAIGELRNAQFGASPTSAMLLSVCLRTGSDTGMGKMYGYCRVSTDEQAVGLQADALMRAGVACDNVFTDMGVSGAMPAMERPGFAALLAQVSAGDTITVWKLDRLGRSVIDLLETAQMLRERGVHLKSLTEELNTGTPMGKMFFTIIASVAEMERAVLSERTRAGIAAARARGARVGRPPVADDKKRALKALVASGMGAEQAGAQLGLSRASAFRIARAE